MFGVCVRKAVQFRRFVYTIEFVYNLDFDLLDWFFKRFLRCISYMLCFYLLVILDYLSSGLAEKIFFARLLLCHFSFGLFCSLFIGSFEVNALISFSCLGIIYSLARTLLFYTMHYRMFKGNRMGDEKKTRQKLPTCLDFLKPSIKTPDRRKPQLVCQCFLVHLLSPDQMTQL